MAIKIVVNLTEPAADLITGYGAGAKLVLERDTTSSFLAPSTVSQPPLVSGTEQYEIWDANGSAASWYRSRITNSGGTSFSDWSDAFQATALSAYATVDDVVETMNFGASDQSQYNLIADLLVDATDAINQMCGRDFFRHPQVSGTEARTYQIVNPNESNLMRALGMSIDIISLTTVEIADHSTPSTYTTIVAGADGYYLYPEYPATGWPYDDLALSSLGEVYSRFPDGGNVRLTGVFGFSSVPKLVKRACIDQVREWYRQGPGGGGPIGMSALGQPIFQKGLPPTMTQLYHSDYRLMSFVNV